MTKNGDHQLGKGGGKGPPAKAYKLNVQGVPIDSDEPTITVKAAMEKAGFDTSQEWIMILRSAGNPKQVVTLTYVIDLTDPGLEKLRLTPKQINNGEATPRRHDFDLLPVDEAHLNKLGCFWETIIEGGARWLLIHGYPVLPGYTVSEITLALQIPVAYPGGQIDMFYCLPALVLQDGRAIERTDVRMLIAGSTYQRWSRHRPDGSWNRYKDNVVTHLTLVDESICREVGH